MVHRRRWLLLGCMFLGGLAGMGAIAGDHAGLRRPRAAGHRAGRRPAGATVATASQTPDSASVDSQVQILASRSLAREVIAAARARRRPGADRCRPPAPACSPACCRGRAAVGRAPGRRSTWSGEFLERLAVKREGKSHVIAVIYRSARSGEGGRGRQQAGRALHGRPAQPARTRRRAARAAGSTPSCRRSRASSTAPRRRWRLSARDSEARARRDARRRPGRDRRPERPARGRRGRARRQGRDARAGCGSRSRAATLSAALGELGSSALLDNLAGAQGRAAAARGRARPASTASATRRSRTSAPRRRKLDWRIREERRALLRQFEGEVARARAGERTLAGKLAELKGKALRREADAERTAGAGARGRAEPPALRSLPRAGQQPRSGRWRRAGAGRAGDLRGGGAGRCRASPSPG